MTHMHSSISNLTFPRNTSQATRGSAIAEKASCIVSRTGSRYESVSGFDTDSDPDSDLDFDLIDKDSDFDFHLDLDLDLSREPDLDTDPDSDPNFVPDSQPDCNPYPDWVWTRSATRTAL